MHPYLKTLLTLFLILGLAAWGWSQVVINEVLINDSGDDDSCYVELFGTPGIDLSGYTLVGVNGYNGTEYNSITLSGTIPGDGFFVIGQTNFAAYVDLTSANVNYQNGPDNILLKQGSTIVDALGYGNFVSPDTFFVGEGSPAPNQVSGMSLQRSPNGVDTNDNFEDFFLFEPTPGDTNPGEPPPPPPFVSLYDLRTNQATYMGTLVKTAGIANVDAMLFGGTYMSAYIQDETAGVNLYGGTWAFVPGDCVTVTGTVGDYNGLLEIMNATELIVGPNVGTPTPVDIDCQVANDNGEALEGMLVRIMNAWIAASSDPWPDPGSNANLTITDNTGATLVMRIDKETNLDEWNAHPLPEDPHFNITGIINQFTVYQLLPRDTLDLTVGIIPEQNANLPRGFALDNPSPNPFNPTTSVRFSLEKAGWVNLDVYTSSGSRVASLTQGFYHPGAHQIVWNAEGLSSGIYFLRLNSGEQTAITKAVLLR